MHAEQRIYRTADGELVDEGHSAAAFLHYAVGDEVSKADEATLKERAKPADKARAKPSTKAAD